MFDSLARPQVSPQFAIYYQIKFSYGLVTLKPFSFMEIEPYFFHHKLSVCLNWQRLWQNHYLPR